MKTFLFYLKLCLAISGGIITDIILCTYDRGLIFRPLIQKVDSILHEDSKKRYLARVFRYYDVMLEDFGAVAMIELFPDWNKQNENAAKNAAPLLNNIIPPIPPHPMDTFARQKAADAIPAPVSATPLMPLLRYRIAHDKGRYLSNYRKFPRAAIDALDFSWMKQALAYEKWYPWQQAPYNQQSFDHLIPHLTGDFRPLLTWAKLRLVKAFYQRELPETIIELRHLAYLLFTTEMYGAQNIALAILKEERRARDLYQKFNWPLESSLSMIENKSLKTMKRLLDTFYGLLRPGAVTKLSIISDVLEDKSTIICAAVEKILHEEYFSVLPFIDQNYRLAFKKLVHNYRCHAPVLIDLIGNRNKNYEKSRFKNIFKGVIYQYGRRFPALKQFFQNNSVQWNSELFLPYDIAKDPAN